MTFRLNQNSEHYTIRHTNLKQNKKKRESQLKINK